MLLPALMPVCLGSGAVRSLTASGSLLLVLAVTFIRPEVGACGLLAAVADVVTHRFEERFFGLLVRRHARKIAVFAFFKVV
mgnify:CR=1 FL=1